MWFNSLMSLLGVRLVSSGREMPEHWGRHLERRRPPYESTYAFVGNHPQSASYRSRSRPLTPRNDGKLKSSRRRTMMNLHNCMHPDVRLFRSFLFHLWYTGYVVWCNRRNLACPALHFPPRSRFLTSLCTRSTNDTKCHDTHCTIHSCGYFATPLLSASDHDL